MNNFSLRPSHTSLKHRDRGQNHSEDLSHKDFRRELEEKERLAARERREQREARREDRRGIEAST